LSTGRAAAPFVATRYLKQLTEDETTNYAEAAMVAANGIYIDIITGADGLHQASKLQHDLYCGRRVNFT
jgi:hypothetical protein